MTSATRGDGRADPLGERAISTDMDRIIVTILFIVALAGLVFLMEFGVGSGPVAPTAQCRDNLHLISIALENYHDAYGSFPPTYVADASGTPLYSWRVLILPFIDHAPLYNEFDLTKPWDAPENRHLSDLLIDIYRCPCNPTEDATTNYFAVVGPDAAWHGSVPVRKSQLGDDLSTTILLVELADTRTPWAKPDDLAFSTLEHGVNISDVNGVSSYHCRDWTYAFKNGKPGANVLFADGESQYLPATFDPQRLSDLMTVSPSDAQQRTRPQSPASMPDRLAL